MDKAIKMMNSKPIILNGLTGSAKIPIDFAEFLLKCLHKIQRKDPKKFAQIKNILAKSAMNYGEQYLLMEIIFNGRGIDKAYAYDSSALDGVASKMPYFLRCFSIIPNHELLKPFFIHEVKKIGLFVDMDERTR